MVIGNRDNDDELIKHLVLLGGCPLHFNRQIADKAEAKGGIVSQDFVAQGYGILTLNPKKAWAAQQ